MTNLYFGFPDIPYYSILIESSRDYDPLFTHENLISGQIHQGARIAEAVSDATVALTYDLGEDGDRACEYLYIADAAAAIAKFTTEVLLESSSDGTSWTSRYADASFAGASLVGPNSKDYLATFEATSAFRYWRVTFTNNTGANEYGEFPMRALFFGMFLDVGCAPSSWAFNVNNEKQELYKSGSGALFLENSTNTKAMLTLQYDDLADEEVDSVIDALVRRKLEHNFLLYTSDYHDIINNSGAILMKLVEEDKSASHMTLDDESPITNTLRLVFEEVA